VSAAMSEQGQQLKQEMGDVVGTAKDQVVELRDTARTRIEEEVDRRRTELGTGARRVADATRETGDQLRGEGKELPAMLIERAAMGMERAASYLESTDAEQVWQDVRDVGRRMPWLFVAAGAVVGFSASRMIKAAGENDQQWAGQRPMMSDADGPMMSGADRMSATTDLSGGPTMSGTGSPSMPAAPSAEESPFAAGRSGVTGS
jgi:hypothetical protein